MRQGTWIVALVALGLGASACASATEWRSWSEHTTHFASGEHLDFSGRNRDPWRPRIAEADVTAATAEGWWGALVPPASPADVSGRWRGTWRSPGLFGLPRASAAEVVLVQRGS